jgi:hypothetical protein
MSPVRVVTSMASVPWVEFPKGPPRLTQLDTHLVVVAWSLPIMPFATSAFLVSFPCLAYNRGPKIAFLAEKFSF